MFVGGGALLAKKRPQQVEITIPQCKRVVESISASGRLRGEVETSVGAATGGRVSALFLKESQRVQKGQLLAQLDNQVLEAQRAQSSVRTAEVQLRQAKRGPLPDDVTRLKADVVQNIAVAKTKVARSKSRLTGAQQKLLAAQQRLAKLKAGSRLEEVEQAEAQVRQSEANLTQAKRDNERQSELLAARAISRNQVELAQLKNGTRPEQLRQAEADVAAAEAEVRTASSEVTAAQASRTGAEKSGQAQIRSLLSSPRPEDVAVAEARLEEARRAESTARQRLSEATELRSMSISRCSTHRAGFAPGRPSW